MLLALSAPSLACNEAETRTWAMRPIDRDYTFPARDARGEVISAGLTVSARDLDEGRMAYVSFCASCHGLDGDGRGPASRGLRPRPRDFRAATFKFAAVRSGELPNDDDLRRLIRHGANGTAMPPWGLDEPEVTRIAHFLKTFPPPGCAPDAPECAPGGPRAGPWTAVHASGPRRGSLANTTGAPVHVTDDPWTGKREDAVREGESLYHLGAQCMSCHPSYLTESELSALSMRVEGKPLSGVRARLHESVPLAADKNPHADEIPPPDFTSDDLRSIRAGREMDDTYRVIAAGVGGVMPAWVDALSREQVWALAWYVRSLADLRRPERAGDRTALRRKLGLSP